MSSKRMTVVIPGKPPRNPVIAVLKTRKGGAHGPTFKALRSQDRQNIKRGIYGTDEVPFPLVLTVRPTLRVTFRSYRPC